MANDIALPDLPCSDSTVGMYQGEGVLILDGPEETDCVFTCAQTPNGEIRVACACDLSSVPEFSWPRIRVSGFHGQTEDGKTLVAGGVFAVTDLTIELETDPRRFEVEFLVSEVTVSQEPGEHVAKSLSFLCINFGFLGTTQSPSGLALPVVAGGHKVVIYPVPQHKKAMDRLRARGGEEVTCTIKIEVDEEFDAAQALDLIRNVCLLLSLAGGTHVTWVAYDVCSEENVRYCTVHRDSPTKPYTAMPLLNTRFGEHVTKLVNSCYDRFVDVMQPYSLDEAIGAFVDARGSSFLETRGLAAVSLLDVLSGRWARLHDKVYIVAPRRFKRVRSELKCGIEQLVRETIPEFDKEQAKAMATHTGSLNRYSLRTVLTAMFEDLGMECSSGELSSFTKSRNSLVHQGTYRTGSPVGEYRAILSLLDRVLLRLIGYPGCYIDWRDGESRQM